MKIAIILALVGLAVALPTGKEQPLEPAGRNPGRIVGGVEATPGEFPFIVDMRRGSHYCAGSIIATDPMATSSAWVVTAAHCSTAQPSAYTLTAGDHNINTVNGTEQTRQVVGIIQHPSYGSPLQYENDIALMKVDPPFEFNEWVQPVVLPDVNHAPLAVATVTGWGALTEGGSSPSNLMKVDVPFVDDDTCNRAYSGNVASSMVCYGEGGKDSCQGDSGGPIVNQVGDEKVLVGIVSWGQGCARPGYPGVYTETSYYIDWIRTSTVPTAEDPEPITTVSDCGGLIESSSATIDFHAHSPLTPGQHCVWTLKAPYDTLRFNLGQSGLTAADALYVTKYDGGSASPGQQIQISNTNQNYTISGGMVLITLVVGQNSTAEGINLSAFSSGYGDSSPALSGFSALTDDTGSFSYPMNGGQYANGESALFVLSPGHAGSKAVTFSRVDVESGSNCPYDAVTVYAWQSGSYVALQKFCGNALPGTFQFPSGVGFVSFVTDSSITATGFTFNWQ